MQQKTLRLYAGARPWHWARRAGAKKNGTPRTKRYRGTAGELRLPRNHAITDAEQLHSVVLWQARHADEAGDAAGWLIFGRYSKWNKPISDARPNGKRHHYPITAMVQCNFRLNLNCLVTESSE
jgi:hypothetical protein